MTEVAILGAGAFGTALAVALGRTGIDVMLWARDAASARTIAETRRNEARLPGVELPGSVTVSAEIGQLGDRQTVLLALPMQRLGAFLTDNATHLDGRSLVSCSKGIDLATLEGASALIARHCPHSKAAVLTGPSFAADIARSLPTALTLACADEVEGARLQATLATPTLRLYRATDVIGAELGGALKNVIAIAAGIVMGAQLGESARAALMTRGFAELSRFALALGARAETLAGLSGFGDLVLTCTSSQSRNFRFGQALGSGVAFDPRITVEGAATARAVAKLAGQRGIDMPVTSMVAAVLDQVLTIPEAVEALLSRPLKQE